MLTRVLCALLLWISVANAEQHPPHMVLVQVERDDSEVFLLDGWRHMSGDCVVSPGRSAIQTALLFGTPPLEQGVVSDLDWRRKSVAGKTLADAMESAHYNTLFYGAWALGSTAPYDPLSRGFEKAYFFENAEHAAITDPWGKSAKKIPPLFAKLDSNRAFFRYIVQGRRLSRQQIMSQLLAWMRETKEPAEVIILETNPMKKDKYHYPAKWYYLTKNNLVKEPDIQRDINIHELLIGRLTKRVPLLTTNSFFHKANWPLHESVEKNRFRGSLVISQNLALVDGLSLYRSNANQPDLSQPFDIADHADKHTRLLTAYGKWWQSASRALNDPRAFSVGEKDNQTTRLTALDWRPSKIVDAEEVSPTSVPVVEQQYLLDLLAGLKNNTEYKNKFPAYSGSWSVNIKRPGRYQITASLLPLSVQDPNRKELMKLRGGTAHIRLGSNVAQLNITPGATAISLQTDAEAGTTDLECWFTGQLALTRELGAFFVEVKRVGDKKFDLKAK